MIGASVSCAWCLVRSARKQVGKVAVGIKRFEDIEGWQMTRELTRMVCRATKNDGFKRDFELRDQIWAAAGSSMHSIAEGSNDGSHAEFVKFLSYAQRSCSKVQSRLCIALDETYITQQEFSTIYEQTAATKRKIGAFIKYIKRQKECLMWDSWCFVEQLTYRTDH